MEKSKPLQEKGLGQRSLENALATSFKILKWAMIVVVVAMLFSGIFVVGPGEKAVRVRFGNMVGAGARKVLSPGVHFAWPYPIESYIKVPVDKVMTVQADAMMFRDSIDPKRHSAAPQSLHPVQDGYTLTADRNIMHTKWTIKYRITDVVDYIIGVEDLDLMLENTLYDAAIEVSGGFTITDAWLERQPDFIDDVTKQFKRRLAIVPTGVDIISLNLVYVGPPVQTIMAFRRAQYASEESEKTINDALGEATKKMNEVAGTETAAHRILLAINAVEAAEKKQQPEKIAAARTTLRAELDKASGKVASILSEAKAYKNRIVEQTQADANNFERLLPQFRANPEIFIDQIYQEAITEALESVHETWIITGQPEQTRIYIGRDPALVEKEKAEQQAKDLEAR